MTPPVQTPDTSDTPDRRLSPRARRRTWAESAVRLWLVLAAVLLLIAAIFVATSLGDYLDERDLVVRGESKIGTIVTIQGDRGRYDEPRDLVVPVEVSFERDDGSTFSERVDLISRPGEVVSVGDQIEIRTRPVGARFDVTDRLEPPPIMERFLPLPILLGLAALSFFVAFIRRRGVLDLATHGQTRSAIVVEQKTSPLAPASKLVRFHYTDDENRRVYGLLHPNPAPTKGETFDVLSKPAKPGQAVAASLYKAQN